MDWPILKILDRKFFNTFSVVSLLSLFILSGITVFLTAADVTQFRENHERVFESEINGARVSIESFLESRQRLVKTFSIEKADLLFEFSVDVENEELRAQITDSLKRWFPNYFTFTLADKNGIDLIDDIEGFIGPICVANIEGFLNNLTGGKNDDGHMGNVVIHPQAFNYHFDIMAPWKFDDQLNGVFFVSFFPDVIQSILKSYESEGHNLIILNKEEAPLIEVTSGGARDEISAFREILLSDAEIGNIVLSEDIARSQWTIVAIPDENLFRNYNWEQWASSFSIILGLVLMTGLSLNATSRLEKKRKDSHNLLLASRNDLKDRVSELRSSHDLIAQQAEELLTVLDKESKLRIETDRLYKSKSQFLATMSHEIRTPMAGIIGLAKLMVDEGLPKKHLEWANSIKSASENLIQILNEILDQSKLEAGKIEILPVKFRLETFIHEAVQLFKPMVQEKNINLKIIFGEDCPDYVNADKLRVGQILNNLLGNALKFTHEGEISVHLTYLPCDQKHFWLKIAVEDTGIGIDEEGVKNLFESYAQADNSISAKYGGTGLGLSISKQLAELMRGEIGVTSEKGVGSVFWFTIKCEYVADTDIVDDQVNPVKNWRSLRSLRILIAEDNSIIQMLIKGLFSNLKHDLHIVGDGQAAVDKVDREKFDLILMDIRMPGMGGFEATSIIREKTSKTQRIPIIALSADVSSENNDLFVRSGMDDACSKPIELDDLLPKINRVLKEDVHFICENENKGENDITFESTSVGDSKNNTSPLGVDDEVYSKLITLFESETIEKCDSILNEISTSSKQSIDDDALKSMKSSVHIIKGQGSSLGYPLLTSIATEMESLLKADGGLPVEIQDMLQHYVEAMKHITESKMTGSGGVAGEALEKRLQDDIRNLKNRR